jgi:hypothetical protein
MSRRQKSAAPSVVAAVQEQSAQAAALAEIPGQARLTDPRTNPAVRGHADEMRDDQQRRALDHEHARTVRRLRVSDRRAGDAERTLEAIQLARQASSPARSVMALHNGRRLYTRLSTAASVVLAAGSAMGVEEAAQALGAPTGSGYIAEIGLTGLATVAITYRAHLAEHGGTLAAKSWQTRSLWALMVVPLLISVTANLAKANAIGAACAIGAAAFALLACVIADRSAAAMQARAAEVSAEDEAELEARAMGEDLFTAVPDEDEREDDGDAVTGEARAGVDELAAWLADREPPQEGGTPTLPAPVPDGDQDGAACALPGGHIDPPSAEGHIAGGPGGHIDSDQERREPSGGAIVAAVQARRAIGASTRNSIAAYLADHPKDTNKQVAAALEMSEATVKRHRRALRRLTGGGR